MDKAALTAPRIESEDLTIPGVGVIKVRGLSRFELHVSGKGTEDGSLIERRMVAAAMVDPEMTVADVEAWQKAATAGEFKAVTEKIRDLSGLAEGADKSSVSEARD